MAQPVRAKPIERLRNRPVHAQAEDDLRILTFANGSTQSRASAARPRRQRPRRRRAAEQRDELAALHSITSLAMASKVFGIARPMALAVLRLMTSSNLVGCTTGKSPAFSP